MILDALSADVRAKLEAKMLQNWKPRSEFLRKLDAAAREEARVEALEEGRQEGREEGRQEGLVSALRNVVRRHLEARGLEPDEQALEHAGVERLNVWVESLILGQIPEGLPTR